LRRDEPAGDIDVFGSNALLPIKVSAAPLAESTISPQALPVSVALPVRLTVSAVRALPVQVEVSARIAVVDHNAG